MADIHLFYSGSIFSNFAEASFAENWKNLPKGFEFATQKDLPNLLFSSSEQYFMFMKALYFDDITAAKAILMTTNPKEAKRIGRTVKHFDEQRWSLVDELIMERAIYLKFSSNPERKRLLLGTSGIIAEASPRDRKWGIGMSASNADALNPALWKGQNLLGKALMRVRDRLRGENVV